MRKLLLTLFVLTILSSCTRYVTNTEIVETVRDSIVVKWSDTTITVTPDPVIIKKDSIIEVPAECGKIYTDTTWVEGTYADAFAIIWANRLIVGIKEGKQFELKLKNAINEKEYWKKRYYSEKQTVVEQPTFFEKFSRQVKILIGAVILILVLIIVIKLIK